MDSVIHGMSMADYRKEPAVSASDLKNMQRSAAYARLRPSKPTQAKDWGNAIHTAVLEPETIGDRYTLDPESPKGGYPSGWRNSNDYKAAAAAARSGGLELLTADEFDQLQQIAANVAAHDVGAQLHALPGFREVSVFTNDEEFGVRRKCRPDWLIPNARMIVDVKSARDHRPGPFARACNAYGYHLSAAYYLDTVSTEIDVEHFVLLVVNAEPPFEVAAYTLDRDSIEQGRKEYREALAAWAKCQKEGEWPGGSGQIEEIRIPDYAINYQMEEDQWR